VSLTFFVLSPFADIYTDSLFSPFFFFNGQNDSDDQVITDELNLNNSHLNSIQTIVSAYASHHYAFLQASIKYRSACQIEENEQISVNKIKSSQLCPSVSSDPSPPVI
jgi:hypothetical protein